MKPCGVPPTPSSASPCERIVNERPAVRQQGDTTIYSVVEEQLVVTRQLMLREEIHVTLHESERRDTSTYTLQREHVEVEHITPPSALTRGES